MEIDKKLYAEIKEYCELNGLKVRQYIESILKRAFMEDKYGKCPPMFKTRVQNPISETSKPISTEKEAPKMVEIYREPLKNTIKQEAAVEQSKEIKEKQDNKTVTSKTKKRTLN